ncbi:TetR family transcriptional regulator [Mycobacterium kiyosense]|uniref:TetR family transcriptional regulator n=1 Tax=Mycobacterium kiyosense TaxID=2871094 RepID=A0A9P3Q486_9MYCO|nr:TetR family transcriptional regulator [Mycobacterium kiyosense]BDE13521.1 TetR family transcriptional regulator [Mycobacterium sp. 20KCMC460]GLB84141.1 TetR family transcriptional regulator [Mycobacterium kiyosense]GLB88454.1 TetR family transcriptional regulator [Mycobacterium kiyosense]GLB94621.1 TetR family transcriptional regulator [Mycobacterium kiyosense]
MPASYPGNGGTNLPGSAEPNYFDYLCDFPVGSRALRDNCQDAQGRSDLTVSSPRLHHHDYVLDSAEDLVAQDGIEAVTIRALTKVTGVSNGGIYRAFESRGGLLGRVWIRAERRFLDLLTSLVDEARDAPGSAPIDAVHAAAETSLLYPKMFPGSSACLMTVRRADVVSQPMPPAVAEQLRALDNELAAVMAKLAENLWGRSDVSAVDLIATCIIDLPKWIGLRGHQHGMPVVRNYLRAAVRSVLEVGPPPAEAGHELVANGARCGGAA